MNPRPRDYDSPALPLSYSAVRNAEPVGANARVIYGRVPRVSSAEPGRGRLPSGGGTVDPAAAYEARADVADTGLTGGNTGLRLVKVGRLLRGWADITVRTDPERPDGALVDWTEELWLPGLRGPTRRLGDRVGPIVFGRVVDAVLARAADDDQDAVRPTRPGSAP